MKEKKELNNSNTLLQEAEAPIVKTKHPGGRPTKYKSSFCQDILDFFNGPQYKDVTIPHYKKGELAWKDIKRMPNKLPTIVEFANHIGVCYATVYDWIDPKMGSFQPEFLQAFTRARAAQKNFLIQNAIQGLYNPLFSKFVAINITDMQDQALVDNSKHYHIKYDYRNKPKKDKVVQRVNKSLIKKEEEGKAR